MTYTDVETRADRTMVVAFLAFVSLAGGNVVAIRYVSCETCELEPFWAAGSRFAAAAVILAGIALAVRAGLPRGRALVGAITYGILGFAAPFGLAYWGLQRASASFGAVVLATIPLLTLMFALAHRQERFRWGGLVGGLLALAGMVAIFNEGLDAGVPLASLVAFLVAAACFAETNIVVKAFPRVHPAAMNAIGLGTGGTILIGLSFAMGEAHIVPELARTWIAQVYLVVLGSVAVFTLYVFVIHRWTASAVSYEGVLIPLVAILLSVWLQDERITWSFAGGSVLVLLGVYFGVLRGEEAAGGDGRRALVVKPHQLSASGFVGERLQERGFELVEHVAADGGAMPALDGFDAVVVMGSPWSVYGPEVEPWIGGLLDLLRDADNRGVGVLGVCFGAQSLAAAFGAEVYRGELEFGWHEVESADPELVPPGPWFMWHSDRFDLPQGATELARTEANGPQAYAFGPHLCVQFHPEADAAIVTAWVGHDATDLDAAGVSKDAVLDETATWEPDARRRAHSLVDAFLERAGVPSRR